jgi:hypothetical protein
MQSEFYFKNDCDCSNKELVCRRPFPSMPSHYVNDPPPGERYRRAYFARFPGWWTHGDFISVSSTTGGVTVFGRWEFFISKIFNFLNIIYYDNRKIDLKYWNFAREC